jgi:hypothetical protein
LSQLRSWLVEAKDDVVQLSEIATSETASTLITKILDLVAVDEDSQIGGTWILKHLVEKGDDLSTAQVASLLGAIEGFQQWQSKVHILQLSTKSATFRPEMIAPWSIVHTGSNNKFLAAWAIYVSVVGLAETDPKQAKEILERGLASSSGSIRARAKKAAEELVNLNNQ